MRTIRIVASLALLSVSLSAAERAPRKVLFFDLWKLDYWDNVELRQGEPEWVRECNYIDPAAPDRNIVFPSVWRDEASDKWCMVYSIKWSPYTMMAAESEDGIRWKPLAVDDVEFEGERIATNHLLTVSAAGGGVYRDLEKTDGYGFRIFGRQHGEAVFERALADPNHRWHEIAKAEGEKRYFGEGITIVSKDGLHWEIKTGGKWDWLQDDWFPEPPTFAFWNEAKQTHVLAVRSGWGDRRQCLLETARFRNLGSAGNCSSNRTVSIRKGRRDFMACR